MILLTEKQKNIIKECVEWGICIIIAIIVALFIRYYVGTPTKVEQTSMYPTLKPESRLWLNRLSRTFKEMPKRDEIITFEAPTDGKEPDINNPVAKYDNEPKSLFNKFSYYVLEYKNFEVKGGKKKQSFIKRVIALPGEHVKIENGKVYINGNELEEKYLPNGVYTTSENKPYVDIIVPENCIYALGDNRGNSKDCRNFGCIPFEKIEGKVLFRYWPLNVFGKVE